jgi:hypothetical protein
MGEMADYYLETMVDDDLLYDYGGTLSCRCCGASNLHWGQLDDGRWVLVEDWLTAKIGGIHNCPVNPLKPRKKG